MTCAKKHVECVIIAADGGRYYGTNACETPQNACPRLEGEGYVKCKTICSQYGHAEEMALKEARDHNADLKGASAHIKGIGHYCRLCQHKLTNAGVKTLEFIK